MSDDVTSLAEKVNRETPWWAAMPVLAASIVAVPSFLAIMTIYYLAGSVSKHLAELMSLNQTEISELHVISGNQQKYWEMVRRTLAMSLEVQLRECVHRAADQKERDDCMKGISGIGNGALLQ